MPWWSKVAIGRWQRKSGQRSIVVGRSSTYRTASSAFGRYPSSPRMARKRQGFRLLSEYASDEADGRLYVALNPLIAQAVMGGGAACAHQHGRGAGAGQRNRPPAAPAAVWLDRPRQNRQGFHRYLVRLCLAVRGQWFDHAQAPPAGARGVAGAGRAGLDGNRVRGGQVRHHPPKAAGCPPLYCKQDIFIFYIQWLIFLLIGNTMKNTMLRKGLTIF